MAAKVSNKTVVVTGGSRGIGLEWVKTLLQQGNTVVATARDPSQSTGLQQLLKQHGDRLTLTSLEASSPESIAKWAEGLKGKISHIDVLINNAGVDFETFEHGLSDVTPKLFKDTFSVNTLGPLLVTQELLKHGLLGGDVPTLIIYTSSLLASIGGFTFPIAKMYAYRASKAALNMLVRTSVEELASKNITSVLLDPGYVATDMTAGHTGTATANQISTVESITGQLKVIEDGRPLNGKFYSYSGEEVAW